jgi:short-subunit dehydrogenase
MHEDSELEDRVSTRLHDRPRKKLGTLTGHVALVTGASSGIGRAIAIELADHGSDVVLFARRAHRLAEVAARIRALDRRVAIAPGDVTHDDDLPRAVATAHAAFGPVDVVVANAGFEVTGRVDELTLADFRRQFETNVFGVLRTIYATLDDLAERRGRLVLIGSQLGYIAIPNTAAYSMSKFAVRALAQVLRFELARDGISVTLVTPGNVDSEIRRVDNHDVLHAELADPMPRWLTISPERAAREIVEAVIRRRAECTLTRLARVAVSMERRAPRLLDAAIRFGGIRGRREPGRTR